MTCAMSASERMTSPIRRLLGSHRRVPDTTLRDAARRWLGSRTAVEADATSEDCGRGVSITRRLFLGKVTVELDGWQSLRTVLRVDTELRDRSGRLIRRDDRYLTTTRAELQRLPRRHTVTQLC
jgi:hypothetical protein